MQNSLHLNFPFSSLAFLLLYISTHSPSCHPMSNTTDQKWFHLTSIFRWHLLSSNIVVSSNPYPYELATIKVKRCRFMGFVKDAIDCECLECVFCLRIKEKEINKDTCYINFYSTIFLQSFFFFFFNFSSAWIE